MDVMQMGPRPPPESDKKRMGLIQNLPERERERERGPESLKKAGGRPCLTAPFLPSLSALDKKEAATHGCQMAKFDPFLSLDCARVEGVGA